MKKLHLNINTYKDLMGKKVFAVDENSLGGYQMVLRELHQLDIKTSTFSKIEFGGTHDKVVLAVKKGQYDVGLIRTGILEKMSKEGRIKLKNYKIISKKELVEDIIKLEEKVSITIKNKNIEKLSFEEKKKIFIEILLELEKQLERKRNIKIGSKSFKNKFKIVDTFKEYTKNEDNVKGFNEELNHKTTTSTDFKIKNTSLFYYDNISWDSNLEKELYVLFDKSLNSENYLVIRNEVEFKMFNPFTEKTNEEEKYSNINSNIFEFNGDGFEPDFIVLKKGLDNKIFQFFIEVKGKDKVDTKINKWKEILLTEINNEKIIIEDNIEYKIYGLPFFTENDIRNDSIKNTYIDNMDKNNNK